MRLACANGRGREYGTANTTVRKTQGDRLEHNVGHGQQSLSVLLLRLHLRAFVRPTMFWLKGLQIRVAEKRVVQALNVLRG